MSHYDVRKLFDTILEMAVAMAIVEKRPTKVETPAKVSEPECMLLSPPPLA